MANIELKLLSTMLHRGDFGPLLRGEVTADHFVTDEGKILYNFITTYRASTDGVARFPSLDIVRNRFDEDRIELPPPNPGDDIAGLVHETLLQKARADMKVASQQLAYAASDPKNPMEHIPEVLRNLRKMAEGVQKAKHMSLADSFEGIIADYDDGEILPEGLPWPWPSLTGATRGMHNKEFYVIAGRPKSRKTFTALAVGAYAMKEHNARVLFISPEMPSRQVMLRFIATICELRYMEFRNSALDKMEETRLLEAARLYGKIGDEKDNEDLYNFKLRSKIPGLPDHCLPGFDVVQGTNKNVHWIESQIELFRPDIVIVDSFYRLVASGGRKSDADWKIVTAISRELKDLAMDANVRLIGTHQMNRDAANKVGGLENMALADAVGQDADLILRVITGKIEGIDRSALVVLGGREVPFDGVLINNRPCFDFTEVGPITSTKTVKKLMQQEDREEETDKKERKAVTKAEKAVNTIKKKQQSAAEKKSSKRKAYPSFEAPEEEEEEAKA